MKRDVCCDCDSPCHPLNERVEKMKKRKESLGLKRDEQQTRSASKRMSREIEKQQVLAMDSSTERLWNLPDSDPRVETEETK